MALEPLFNSCYPAFDGKEVKWTERGYDENVFETLDVSLHSFEIRKWKLFDEYPLCFRHFPLTSHLIIQNPLEIGTILILQSRNLNFYFKLLSMVIMQFFFYYFGLILFHKHFICFIILFNIFLFFPPLF